MGFDCRIVLVHKNTKLRWCELESDSLVNDQILREIATSPMTDASFTD